MAGWDQNLHQHLHLVKSVKIVGYHDNCKEKVKISKGKMVTIEVRNKDKKKAVYDFPFCFHSGTGCKKTGRRDHVGRAPSFIWRARWDSVKNQSSHQRKLWMIQSWQRTNTGIIVKQLR